MRRYDIAFLYACMYDCNQSLSNAAAFGDTDASSCAYVELVQLAKRVC